MYQPYPSKDQPPVQARPEPPGPVRIATYFMYGGAVISVVNAVLGIITIGAARDALRHAYPRFTETQVHMAAQAGLVVSLVESAIVIFLWLWLAWACRTGRNWGRITGTVLFALNTVLLLLTLVIRVGGTVLTRASVGTLLSLLIWLAGLGAVVLLWRRESSAFFTSAAGRP